MTTPQITTPGAPPDPLAPQPTFRATFYAYLQQLVTAFGQANTVATWMGTTAATVATNATTASNAATAATAAANYKGAYDAGTLYAIGESVRYLGGVWLKETTAPAGTTPEAGANWTLIPANLTPTYTGNVDFIGTANVDAVFENDAALSGATPSLDVSAAQEFTLTTSANTTVTITGTQTGESWVRTLLVTLGGAHTFAITGADWGDDGAPGSLASGVELEITLRGNGSTFRASETWRKTP